MRRTFRRPVAGRHQDLLRAGIPLTLLAAVLWFGGTPGIQRSAGAVRPAAPASAAPCRGDLLQELAGRRMSALPPAVVAQERNLLGIMQGAGRKRLDRYVIARALAVDDGRYDDGGLVQELDEIVLSHLLSSSPAFQKVLNPPPPPKEPVVPVRPQQLAPDAAPETSNDLLEALRESPKPPAPPPRPRPPVFDALGEAARYAGALGQSAVKVASFLAVYGERPEVFSPLFANHRDDARFADAFEDAVARNLRADLKTHLSAIFLRVAAHLEAQGYGRDRLDSMMAEEPGALRDLLHGELAKASAEEPGSGWKFEAGHAAYLARRDLGHFAYGVVMTPTDLLMGALAARPQTVDADWRWQPEDAQLSRESMRRVKRCLGALCLNAR